MIPNPKQAQRIADLQRESRDVLKKVEAGKISRVEAAEKIVAIREEIDRIHVSIRAELEKDINRLL